MPAAMELGCHLLFDGVSEHLLSSLEVHTFLSECPKRIGLTIFSGPHVYPTKNGLAGIVLIAQSHVSVHTNGLEVFGDTFSCLQFDSRVVIDLARELLCLENSPKAVVRVLQRGWATLPGAKIP